MDATSKKPWSELTLLLVLGTAVLIAAAVTGALESPEAWTLLAALAAAYAVSRGVSRNELRLPEPPRRIRATLRPEQAETEPAAEMLVSEEQLQVEKERRPAERVRLRKEVVTEEVTIIVPLRREVVRMERVPVEPGELTEAETPIGISDGQILEVVLMEEQPVVDTRIVPRERVRLTKDVVTSEEHITQTVRHEEVGLDREPPRGTDQANEQESA